MSKQLVDMVFHEPITVYHEHSPSKSITFRTDRWYYRWMGRIALWLLDKVQATNQLPDTEMQRVRFDPGTFLQRLNQRIDLFNAYGPRSPKRVLIGGEDFDELMSEAYHQDGRVGSPWVFEAPVASGYKDDYGQAHVHYYGLPIMVVPTMKGILVL